ncbi:polysaccharide biosynthesis tyrosine autokinase [soil metagenome]
MDSLSNGNLITAEQDHSAAPPSRNYFRIAIERKWYIVLGVILSTVIGAIFYSRQTPSYQNSMQVLLIKKSEILPAQGNEARSSPMDDYVSTQLTLIKTPLVLEKVAKRKELKEFAWAQNPAQAMGYLNAGLTVKGSGGGGASSGSTILVFSFVSLDSRESEPVLRAVYEGYKEFLDETYKDVSKTTSDLIIRTKDVLEGNLQEQEKEYRQFREKTPLTRLKLNKEGSTLNGERLVALQSKLSTLMIRKGEIESHLNALSKAKQKGMTPAQLLEIASRFGRLSAGNSGDRLAASPELSNDQLLMYKAQEEELLREVGPDHPDVQQVRQKMRMLSTYLKEKGTLVAMNQDRSKPGAIIDPLEVHERSLHQEIDELDQTSETYTKILGTEVSQAKDLISSELQEETITNKLARTRELHKILLNQLSVIDLVKDVGGFRAEMISPPPTSGQRVSTPLKTIFGVSTICGLLAGFGLACLAEISDHSFRSPEEIVGRLGVRVVGHIPTMDNISREKAGISSPLSPTLWTHHRSKSRYAEAFRDIRTFLYFSNRDSKSVAIQVTSSRAGDGKTTLTCNLAISLAQAGKKTLLIDADCRRPRVHKLFGLTNEKGLTTVLGDGVQAADVLTTTEVAGLSIITSGPSVVNPSEMLTSPAFVELISNSKLDYDYVLIDSPPILAVSDPSIIASQMDGILLVIRLGKNERVDAERATQVLQGLGGNILGVIVNGVGDKKQGYGYRYGYGARSYYYGAYYGGRYGSTYDKKRDGSYYEEEADKEVVTAKTAFEADDLNETEDEPGEETPEKPARRFVPAPVSSFFRWLGGE